MRRNQCAAGLAAVVAATALIGYAVDAHPGSGGAGITSAVAQPLPSNEVGGSKPATDTTIVSAGPSADQSDGTMIVIAPGSRHNVPAGADRWIIKPA